MNDSFDPYLKWLGIRDPERPPNHYRLLGIDYLESDSDVIATAADRQMAHVRRYQSGSHAQASQDLLNELAAAKLLLLSPEKKEAYDRTLQQSTSQGSRKDMPVVRWAIVTVATIGVLALGIAFAKRNTGGPKIEIADTVDETAQAEIAVNDEPSAQKGNAVDQDDDVDAQEDNVGGQEGNTNGQQEDDADDQTHDSESADPGPPEISPDLPPDCDHEASKDSGSPVSNRPTPPASRDLPPWETEIVEMRPFEFLQTDTILDDIRNSIAEGDLGQARNDLAEAAKDFSDDVWVLDGLRKTTNALGQFQLALGTALKNGVPKGTLLNYGSSPIMVESVDNTQIVLTNGDRKPFSDASTLPPLLAEALAKHVLQDSGNPEADLILGAFWAFSQRGNQEQARLYFDRARHLGLDVDLMLESWQAPGPGIAKTGATQSTNRLTVPKRSDFSRAWTQVRTELALTGRIKTEAQKFSAAKSLIDRAKSERDDHKRYVCLDRAVYYATQSGNTTVALKAVDVIVLDYDVDALRTRHDCLEKLKSTTDPGRAGQVAQAALQAMEDSINEDDYSKARGFLAIAMLTSRRSGDQKLVTRAEELSLQLQRRSSGRRS